MESIKYLIRDRGTKNSAHYWDGSDTYCHLWSTGGMNQRRRWSLHDDPGTHPICTMCISNAKKINRPEEYEDVFLAALSKK